jgi:hypothetical protein
MIEPQGFPSPFASPSEDKAVAEQSRDPGPFTNILDPDIRALACRYATLLNLLDGAAAWEAEHISLMATFADCV